MSLRSGLKEESVQVEGELDYFLNYDEISDHQPKFYAEIARLGRRQEETVDKALSKSETFLRSVTDVDDVFQESRATCLRLVEEIMTFVNRGDEVTPDEAGGLDETRGRLTRKFARLQGSWESLEQSTLDYNKPVTFTKLKELVETTETATDVAISGSKALLRQLMNRQLYEWVGVDNTDESEDDGKDSPLKHDADSIESFNTTADGSEGDGDDSALRHNTGEIIDFNP